MRYVTRLRRSRIIDLFRCVTLPKKTVEAILASGNHYLIQVKANQPSLLGDITKTMNNQIAHSVYQTQEKSRGRLETRTVTTYQVQHSDLQSIWSGLSTYIRVERTRQTAQKTTVEQAFYITDWSMTQKGAEYFYKGIKQHRHIENNLYYVKYNIVAITKYFYYFCKPHFFRVKTMEQTRFSNPKITPLLPCLFGLAMPLVPSFLSVFLSR